MRIAICDDEKILYKEIFELLNEYSRLKNEPITTEHFCSGRDFLASSLPFDLIFMTTRWMILTVWKQLGVSETITKT